MAVQEGYLGNPPRTAQFLVDQFAGDSSTTTFNLQIAPGSGLSIFVFIDGVRQSVDSYVIDLATINFTAAPSTSPSGPGTKNIEVVHITQGFTPVVPSDASVTDAKLTATGVTSGLYGGTANQVIHTVQVNSKGRVSNVANIAVADLDFSALPTGGGSVVAGRLYKEANNLIFIKT
tara:strand:+ start:182 stop:709 length:528 start_codon:yes stop_codon:yes gene_type:complete